MIKISNNNNLNKDANVFKRLKKEYSSLTPEQKEYIQNSFKCGLKEVKLEVESIQVKKVQCLSEDSWKGIILSTILALFILAISFGSAVKDYKNAISSQDNIINIAFSDIPGVDVDCREIRARYFNLTLGDATEKAIQLVKQTIGNNPQFYHLLKGIVDNCDNANSALLWQSLFAFAAIGLGIAYGISQCKNKNKVSKIYQKYSLDRLFLSSKSVSKLKKEIKKTIDKDLESKVRVLIDFNQFFTNSEIDLNQATLNFIAYGGTVRLLHSRMHDDENVHLNYKNEVQQTENSVRKDIATEILELIDDLFVSPIRPIQHTSNFEPISKQDQKTSIDPVPVLSMIKASKEEVQGDEKDVSVIHQKIKTKGKPDPKRQPRAPAPVLSPKINTIYDAMSQKKLNFKDKRDKKEFKEFIETNQYGKLFSANFLKLLNKENSYNLKKITQKCWELKCEGSVRMYFSEDGKSNTFRYEGISKKNDQHLTIENLKKSVG